MWETQVQSLCWEDPLEKEMAAHSSILAWKIPWTEEPGRLQSMGSQRVGQDWEILLSLSFRVLCFHSNYEINYSTCVKYIIGRLIRTAFSLWMVWHQFSSVPKLCLTVGEPIDCSTPGFPVHHQSWNLLMSIEPITPSKHIILSCPLLLLPSIFPSIKVFSNESVLHIRWPKYWSFSFSISPSNIYSWLISFRMD